MNINYHHTFEDIKQLERIITKMKNKEINFKIYYIIQSNHEKCNINQKMSGFIFDYTKLSNKSLSEIDELIKKENILQFNNST